MYDPKQDPYPDPEKIIPDPKHWMEGDLKIAGRRIREREKDRDEGDINIETAVEGRRYKGGGNEKQRWGRKY